MKFFSNKSFKFKLVGAFVALSAVFIVSSYVAFQSVIKQNSKDILNQFHSYSDSLNYAIGAQFYERYGDVQAFAMNNIFFGGHKVEEMQAKLDQYVALYGIYDVILFTDLSGRYIASNTKSPDGKAVNVDKLKSSNYWKYSWFKAAVDGAYVEDKAKAFTGTYFEGPIDNPVAVMALGEGQYDTIFSTQVKDSAGKTIGIMSSHANFKWVETEFVNMYTQLEMQGLDTADLVLMDKAGNVIVDHDPKVIGKNEIKHDFEVLGKFNLIEKGNVAAKALSFGKDGSMFAMHTRKNIEEVVGYHPVSNPKFVDSIGWGVLVRASKAQAFEGLIKTERLFYTVLAIVSIVALILAWLFANTINASITSVIKELGASFAKISSSADSISTASTQLASASTQTASAVEETTTTLQGVAARVESNVKMAEGSSALSEKMKESADDGKQTMNNLSRSMDEILATNEKIEQIAVLIKRISEKTNVIGDIAAQTKILSFNASIEAERAGENGKGFAVVAQEVGKLAQTSVKAATEIGEIVTSSVEEAQKIVVINKEKVTQASEKLEQAIRTLNEFASQASSMTNNSREIFNGSRGQSVAVAEVSKAMQNINSATQETADASESIANSGEELNAQAKVFQATVKTLETIIQGS